MKRSFSIMSNIQTYNYFELDFQKVDQHSGGMWLIHGTKHCNVALYDYLIDEPA